MALGMEEPAAPTPGSGCWESRANCFCCCWSCCSVLTEHRGISWGLPTEKCCREDSAVGSAPFDRGHRTQADVEAASCSGCWGDALLCRPCSHSTSLLVPSSSLPTQEQCCACGFSSQLPLQQHHSVRGFSTQVGAPAGQGTPAKQTFTLL